MKLKYALFLLTLVPIAVVAGYRLQVFNSLIEESNSLRANATIPATQKAFLASDLRHHSAKASAALQDASILGFQGRGSEAVRAAREFQELSRKRAELMEELKALARAKPSLGFFATEQQSLQSLEESLARLSSLEELEASKITSGSPTSLDAFPAQSKGYRDSFESAASAFLEGAERDAQRANGLAESTNGKAVEEFYFSTVLAVAAILLVVAFIYYYIVKPVEGVTAQANAIASGRQDFVSTTLTLRDDEVGELAKSFQRVVASLRIASAKKPRVIENPVTEDV